MRKKLIMGAAVLALLLNAPQVQADDNIVVFGGEFEEETPAQDSRGAVEPPKAAEPVPEEDDDLGDDLIFDDFSTPPEQQPVDEPFTSQTVEPDKVEEPAQIPEAVKVEEPAQIPEAVKVEEPAQIPEAVKVEEPAQITEVVKVEEPAQITEVVKVEEPAQIPEAVKVEEPAQIPEALKVDDSAQILEPVKPQKKLKVLKPRFVKLAVDDTYTYYLDKDSVQWKKMPYSASEYIADVWIRMVERTAKPLEDDMVAYGEENFNAEVALAEEQGYQYSPEDLSVLGNQSYVLEHYYLRPKTHQIQFLCELEVFGRPQNAIKERVYDYKNWENLVPGSVESVIYATVLKVIGTKKASERGHMTFIDMLEEYGRISLR